MTNTIDEERYWQLRLQQQQAMAQTALDQPVQTVATPSPKKAVGAPTLTISNTPADAGAASTGNAPLLTPPAASHLNGDLQKAIARLRAQVNDTRFELSNSIARFNSLIQSGQYAGISSQLASLATAFADISDYQTDAEKKATAGKTASSTASNSALEALQNEDVELSKQLSELGDYKGDLTKAQDAYKTAEIAKDQAAEALKKAKETQENVKEAEKAFEDAKTVWQDAGKTLQTAQANSQKADQITTRQAEIQKAINEKSYAVDVTNVLPKIHELATTTASFIEQIGAANPQLLLQNNFLQAMGIQVTAGQGISQALSAELTNRLTAGGVSKTEAEAIAAFVIDGKGTAINTLPKTTLDIIDQFSNDLEAASKDTCLTLNKVMNRQVGQLIPTNGLDKPQDTRTLSILEHMTAPDLAQEERVTAFLKLMGQIIDDIIELSNRDYEERIALEQQLRNHQHV